MTNETLFIGGTHGDEPIGVEVLRELEKERRDFDWLVGNPPALAMGQREFEGDLNRSAPGDIVSPKFAPRRAAEIIDKAKSYRYTIDLHGANADTGIFIIVTNPTPENFRLAAQLDIERVVVWPSFSSELKGPMSEFFPCGLEIECGLKSDPKTASELKRILDSFLDRKSKPKRQTYFEVYGSLREEPKTPPQEFQKTIIDGETFFPLLINCYMNRTGVYCYKMRSYELAANL